MRVHSRLPRWCRLMWCWETAAHPSATWRDMTTDASAQQSAHRFGTLLGVFTPSVLAILGLIICLRFGWVVGNLGLPVHSWCT
jgi:hypothetical protein